jgi:hypothetical protein
VVGCSQTLKTEFCQHSDQRGLDASGDHVPGPALSLVSLPVSLQLLSEFPHAQLHSQDWLGSRQAEALRCTYM